MVEENFRFTSTETHQNEEFFSKISFNFSPWSKKIFNWRARKRTRMKDLLVKSHLNFQHGWRKFSNGEHLNALEWRIFFGKVFMAEENFQLKSTETHQNEDFWGKISFDILPWLKKIFKLRALKRTRIKGFFGKISFKFFTMAEENFQLKSTETHQYKRFGVNSDPMLCHGWGKF